MLRQPAFDLNRGVGVGKASQLIGSGGHRILVLVVAEDSIFRQLLVYQNATVIDFLVHLVELHLLCRNRMVPQLISDLTLCIHIPDAICFEPYPFLRLVLWAVPGSAAVHLGGLTRHGKEPNQVNALFQLLPLYVQHLTDTIQ